MRQYLPMIAALLLLTAAVQAVCIARAVVPAQDAVRYVEMARAMQSHGVLAVVRATHEEPLFPAMVVATHALLQPFYGSENTPWLLAAQWAAVIPLILAVLPLYGLMLCLVSPRSAALGGVFFAVLSPLARLAADGLSDSTHLLLLITAIYLTTLTWLCLERYFTQRDAAETVAALNRAVPRLPAGALLSGSLAAGLFAGLAPLARAEALVLLPVGLITLALAAPWRPGRRAASLLVASGWTLGVGTVFAVYLWVAGVDHPRTAIQRLTAQALPFDAQDFQRAQHRPLKTRGMRTEEGEVLSFDRKDPETSIRSKGWLAAAREYLKEVPGGFQYGVGILAVLGLFAPIAPDRPKLPARFIGCFWVLYSLAIIASASQWGYMASRHVLPLVVLGLGFAGQGIFMLGDWLAARVSRSSWFARQAAVFSPRKLSTALATLAVVSCLIKTAQPLHASRMPHRLAAEWIALQPLEGSVLDTRGWTGLITGRPTYTYERAPLGWADPDLAFIVLEQHELEHDTARSRTMCQLLEHAAVQVASFPGDSASKAVLVYRWHADRLRTAGRPLSAAPAAN